MQLLDLSDERLPADYYIPTKTTTIAAGATESIRLRGLNAERFGVTRIVFGDNEAYTSGFGGANVFSVTAELVNSRETWFDEVNGQAITSLFRGYSLQVPEIIPAGEEVEFMVTNHAGSSEEVFIGLEGLTADQLAVREETIRRQLGFVPKKRWMYTDNDEVGANEKEDKDLYRDPYDQVFGKLGLGTQGTTNEMEVKLIERTTTRLDTITFAMYHHLSDHEQTKGDPYLFVTRRKQTLTAELTESGGAATRAGVLADTLPVRVLDELGIEY